MRQLLIVDDDPNSRKIIELMLSKEGYQLHFAENGLQALEILEKTRMELVLLDLLMPQLDGFETARQMQATPSLAGIPIMAISALAFPNDRKEAMDAGCDLYLTKPFTRTELLSAIAQITPHQALA